MTTNQAQPTAPVMFCHNSTNIYYPTAPGRVYIISITALADCDGSDEDYSDSTARGDLLDLIDASREGMLIACDLPPLKWLSENDWKDSLIARTQGEIAGDTRTSIEEVADDFADALEQWADWCDRDSVRLDSLDEIKGAIGRAA